MWHATNVKLGLRMCIVPWYAFLMWANPLCEPEWLSGSLFSLTGKYSKMGSMLYIKRPRLTGTGTSKSACVGSNPLHTSPPPSCYIKYLKIRMCFKLGWSCDSLVKGIHQTEIFFMQFMAIHHNGAWFISIKKVSILYWSKVHSKKTVMTLRYICALSSFHLKIACI